METIKIGQQVWFNIPFSGLLTGIIDAISYDEKLDEEVTYISNVEHAYSNDSIPYPNMYQYASRLYASKEEYENSLNQIKDDYRNKIQSVTDLVRIMFETPCNGAEEYADWLLRDVVIEKAKELLNIDLEKED